MRSAHSACRPISSHCPHPWVWKSRTHAFRTHHCRDERARSTADHLRRRWARQRCRTGAAGIVSVFLRRGPWARIQSRSGRSVTPTHVIEDLSSLRGLLRGIQALSDLRVIVSTSGTSRRRAGIAYRCAAHIAAQGKPAAPQATTQIWPPRRHPPANAAHRLLTNPPNRQTRSRPNPHPASLPPPNPPIPWPILSPHGPDMTIRIACPRITMPHVVARA